MRHSFLKTQLYVLFFFVFSSIVRAQEVVPVTTVPDPLSSSNLASMTLGLLVVVVTIFLLAWGFRRFSNLKLGCNADISIIASLSLGGRDRIVLVEVGNEQLLLGVTPGRIRTLHKLDEPIVAAGNVAKKTVEKGAGFQQKFNQLLQQRLRR